MDKTTTVDLRTVLDELAAALIANSHSVAVNRISLYYQQRIHGVRAPMGGDKLVESAAARLELALEIPPMTLVDATDAYLAQVRSAASHARNHAKYVLGQKASDSKNGQTLRKVSELLRQVIDAHS